MERSGHKRAVILGMILAAGLFARYSGGFVYRVPMYVVNGWPFDLEATFADGSKYRIPAGKIFRRGVGAEGEEMVFRSLPAGREFRVRVEETPSFFCRLRRNPCVVINPGGKGVVMFRRSSSGGGGGGEMRLCSGPFMLFEDVARRFEEGGGKGKGRSGGDDGGRLLFYGSNDLAAVLEARNKGFDAEAERFTLERIAAGVASGDLCDFFVNSHTADPSAGLKKLRPFLVKKDADPLLLNIVAQNLAMSRGGEERLREQYLEKKNAHPGDPVYEYLYARLLPPEEALPILQDAVRKRPGFGWGLAEIASDLLALERFDEGASAYLEAYRLMPDYYMLETDCADALVFTGRFREVLGLPDVKSGMPYLYLAALLGLGRTAEAEKAVAEWQGKLDAETLATLRLYIAWRKPDFDAVLRRLARFPSKDQAALYLVFVRLNQGRLREAENVALSIHSVDLFVTGYFALGVTLEKAGLKDAAVRAFEMVVALAGDASGGGPPFGAAAACMLGKKRPEDVVGAALKTRRLIDLAWIYGAFGVREESVGSPEKAEEYFKKALAADNYPGPFLHLVRKWAAPR